MRYMNAWPRLTSTERLECMSSLVSRVLVTDSMLGKTRYVHFLAAMVADYVKENLIVTSANIAQIPYEALTSCARDILDTATRTQERRRLQHVKKQTGSGAGPASSWRPDRDQKPNRSLKQSQSLR